MSKTIISLLRPQTVVTHIQISLQITGNGDVLEPHDDIIGIGSGGTYAIAAARALYSIEGMEAR